MQAFVLQRIWVLKLHAALAIAVVMVCPTRAEEAKVRLLWTYKIDLRHAKSGRFTEVTCFAFSPDNKTLAVSLSDGTARLFECETGNVRCTIDAVQAKGIHSLAYSPNGKLLALGNADGTVQVCAASGIKTAAFTAAARMIRRVAFTADGNQIIALGSEAPKAPDETTEPESRVTVWDVKSATMSSSVGIACRTRIWEFGGDGKMLASAHFSEVKLWDAVTGKQLQDLTVKNEDAFIAGLAFSPDAKTLLTSNDREVTRLWDIGTGKEVAKFIAGRTGEFPYLVFSPDGKHLAARGRVGEAGIVRFFESPNWRECEVIELHPLACLERAVFSPDGRRFATANAVISIRDGDVPTEIKLWDTSRLTGR